MRAQQFRIVARAVASAVVLTLLWTWGGATDLKETPPPGRTLHVDLATDWKLYSSNFGGEWLPKPENADMRVGDRAASPAGTNSYQTIDDDGIWFTYSPVSDCLLAEATADSTVFDLLSGSVMVEVPGPLLASTSPSADGSLARKRTVKAKGTLTSSSGIGGELLAASLTTTKVFSVSIINGQICVSAYWGDATILWPNGTSKVVLQGKSDCFNP